MFFKNKLRVNWPNKIVKKKMFYFYWNWNFLKSCFSMRYLTVIIMILFMIIFLTFLSFIQNLFNKFIKIIFPMGKHLKVRVNYYNSLCNHYNYYETFCYHIYTVPGDRPFLHELTKNNVKLLCYLFLTSCISFEQRLGNKLFYFSFSVFFLFWLIFTIFNCF